MQELNRLTEQSISELVGGSLVPRLFFPLPSNTSERMKLLRDGAKNATVTA